MHRSTVSATTAVNNTIEPEPPNLTNPKRVKKLQKFFGEDPPLMRLFLRTLGYEVKQFFHTHQINEPKSRKFIDIVSFVSSMFIQNYTEICKSI